MCGRRRALGSSEDQPPASQLRARSSRSHSVPPEDEQKAKIDEAIETPYFFTVYLEYIPKEDDVFIMSCLYDVLPMSAVEHD